MSAHTVDEILAASAAWVWFPRDSENGREHLLLVRDPERFGGGVRGSQVESSLSPAEVVDHALERTRAWGAQRFTFWTSSADRPDLEEELRRRGAEHIDTVAVFARPLDGATVDVPADVTVEVVRTLEQVRAVDTVNVPVWQQRPLDAEGLQAEFAEVTAALEAREGFRVLARIGDRAVSTGGCTIDDGFVRLWGASTLATDRGRGGVPCGARGAIAPECHLGSEDGPREGSHLDIGAHPGARRIHSLRRRTGVPPESGGVEPNQTVP
ncbi:hypothetical protein [Microbacterium sp. PAMC22086]|uniref:hypothetical protein n=1 Tax=Microbacterium sp. PAMC22086 TaxID=2861281 RepID=UPI0021597CED|nr:hypothetical protein [Microbacterium sp. PAMC22086]